MGTKKEEVMKPFLTAEWTHVANITYAVDPARLLSHLPLGLELDTIDGKAFVSLVPFNFNNTRIQGIKIPFHSNFPEMNLRFYVKYNERRGVTFLREYVPKFFVAFVANTVYNEKYSLARMKNTLDVSGEQIAMRYEVRVKGQDFFVEVKAENKPGIPGADSMEHFLKERDLGFTGASGSTRYYIVEHPVWEVFPVRSVSMKIDFGVLFGREWEFLNREKPYATMLVKGSAIKVFPDQPLSLLAGQPSPYNLS
jgi:uncharacterized protein